MKILNKNSDGVRNRALAEREVMQELTPGDKNYGKIAVGTDGTYDGEVIIGKDSDVQNALANIDATNPFNGYVGAKKDMRFETSTNNILKVANTQEQYIVDGKVVGTLGPELVVNGDFSDGTSGWHLEDNNPPITIVNGLLRLQNQSTIRQDHIQVKQGKLYKIEYCIVSNSGRVVSYFRDQNGTIIKDTSWDSSIGKRVFLFRVPNDVTSLQVRILSQSDAYFSNISVREISTIDLNTTNDRTGFNGEGDNSFVPHVHVVGFDPISTGTITGNRVATDAQIGTILDNIPAQTANTRIKCRVKPTTDGIKVEILDKSDSDAVVRTQTVDGTDVETLTFTLPVNDDGYKVKATKITNDGVDSDDTNERIDVTAEVSTGAIVDGKVKRGDYVVVDKEELIIGDSSMFTNGVGDWNESNGSQSNPSGKMRMTSQSSNTHIRSMFIMPSLIKGKRYTLYMEYTSQGGGSPRVDVDIDGSDGAGNANSVVSGNGFVFTAGNTNRIDVYLINAPEDAYFEIDNVSLQLADDTFKAIEDTDDGESLGSSKFKPVDYISNQVFVGMKDDGTYVYDVLMNDAYAKESTTETLTNNGYSSLGCGLFSKGSDVIIPIVRIQL